MSELKEAPPRQQEAAEPAPPAKPDVAVPARRGLAWLGLAVLVASAVVGSNMLDVRDRLFGSAIPEPAAPAASRDAFTAVQDAPAAPTKLRSQPWWQDVTTLRGSGSAKASAFTIDEAAIQWRARASCSTGRLVVRAPRRSEPIVDTACPKHVTGEASGDGAIAVAVQADGPWSIAVQQQIDAPLVEPPLPAMTASGAREVATGSFYKVAKRGTGTVTIFRHADGRHSVRLEGFFVTPTSDLELRLSTRARPRTSKQYRESRSRLVGIMDVTAGSLNYVVPAGIDPAQFRSVVVWCAATSEAYAAAGLKRIA